MCSPQFGIETHNHQNQERTARRFRPSLLLLYLGRLDIALDKRIGKGFTKNVAPLRCDDDQVPGGQKSVIWRSARCTQDFLDLLAIRTRIAEPLGRSMLP